jgi:hypothetical protein
MSLLARIYRAFTDARKEVEFPPERLIENLLEGTAAWPDSIDPPPLVKFGEIFWKQAGAELLQERRGQSNRVLAGMRVGGVWVGQWSGAGYDSPQLVPVSSGQLWLSNKRLLFIGRGRTLSLDFHNLAEIKMFSDGIKTVADDGEVVLFRFNPKLIKAQIYWWVELAGAARIIAQERDSEDP